jgi:prevent-host-death family protein
MVVTKSKLKARMLEYFREVERTGEPLVVTDHGREVLEVRPIRKRATAQNVLAEYHGRGGQRVAVISDEELMKPLPEEDWAVLREEDGNPW